MDEYDFDEEIYSTEIVVSSYKDVVVLRIVMTSEEGERIQVNNTMSAEAAAHLAGRLLSESIKVAGEDLVKKQHTYQ